MKRLSLLVGTYLLGSVVLAYGQGDCGLAKPGQAVYEEHCAQCHRGNGEGLPGTFPALKNNPLVLGDPKAVIAVVLEGRQGSRGRMPAWKETLDDQQVAAVVTFIRQTWANQAAGVTPGMVAEVRQAPK